MNKRRLTMDFPVLKDVLTAFTDNAMELVDNYSTPEQVNISEDGECYELSLLAPGRSKADFSVSIENNFITISADAKPIEDKSWIKKEWIIGSFKRRFEMKVNIDINKISAKYDNGILVVKLPKLFDKPNKSVIEVK